MRNAFAEILTEMAGEYPELVFLSGDIGNKLFDHYKEKYRDRFFNCGAAEQGMIGIAAGLAMSGMLPIAYTITPFITYRCYEQIRVDVCYHHLPVIIVGVGSGLSYASLGATHHSLEDIAIMRALPDMTVYTPCDRFETKAALKAALSIGRPAYIRLGKKGEKDIHRTIPNMQDGIWSRISEVNENGARVCLLSCGTITDRTLEIASSLNALSIPTTLISAHTVKPLDTTTLHWAFSTHELVVTLEEHSLIGGFGSAVAEWKTSEGWEYQTPLLSKGTHDTFLHETSDQTYARDMLGLSVKEITDDILQKLGTKKKTAPLTRSTHFPELEKIREAPLQSATPIHERSNTFLSEKDKV